MTYPIAPSARRRLTSRRVLFAAASLLLAACGRDGGNDLVQPAQGAGTVAVAAPARDTAALDTTPVVVDTGVPTPIAASLAPVARGVRRRPPALSPRAESLAVRMVFVPRTQSWFVAAARGKRLLIDVGRVDADLRGDSLRRGAYREAAERLSPLPVGSLVRLRGPWGSEEASITGFDVWNGRIVATLRVSPALDSLARRRDPLVGTALRLTRVDSATAPDTAAGPPPGNTIAAGAPARATDSARAASSTGAPAGSPAGGRFARDSLALAAVADPLAPACRDTLPDLLEERLALVRDSLEFELRTTAMPPYERLHPSVKVASSQAAGCFGTLGRVLVIVSLRAGANEWVRERLVAVDDSGRVAPLRVHDYRFKAHDALYAFDADGDGIDDLAARGIAERSGATVVLRLDPGAKRAERIAGGFAWESR